MKVWLHITSGKGPQECALAVNKLCQRLLKEAKHLQLHCDVIDESETEGGSILLSAEGEGLESFLKKNEGTHLWICQSPIRPTHKRKNWYVGVEVIESENTKITFNLKDVIFQTMKNSGPGGQHVNTTDSAVRATHRPTGISVKATEERSQHMNKKLAIARIQKELDNQSNEALKKNEENKWQNNQSLERGNPIRIFYGMNFTEKKKD
ncbi:MAG: Peptide chain release factor 1 [Holosporales bacterium]